MNWFTAKIKKIALAVLALAAVLVTMTSTGLDDAAVSALTDVVNKLPVAEETVAVPAE